MMNDTWIRVSTVWKWVMAAFFIAMVVLAILAAFRGAGGAGVAAAGGVVIFIWTFGPLEALKQRTTDRLSRSQTIAAGLVPLAGYWAWRFFFTDDTLIFMGVGIVVMLGWLILTVRAEGWSKRAD
jgi:hypothetical protein